MRNSKENKLKNIFNRSRLLFQWRYFRSQTPWDTQVTPPEVMEFIQKTSPGKALDLGCGTGTNAITLASHGWTVTGVDFVPKAIETARRKSAKAGLDITFLAADVATLDLPENSYDYALDIGCLFTLDDPDRIRYAKTLARLLKPCCMPGCPGSGRTSSGASSLKRLTRCSHPHL